MTVSSELALLPASPQIAVVAARLLYLTMGPLAGYWMGVDDEAAARTILERLFIARNSLFSHSFAVCALVGGEPAGIELSYPARTMKALEVGTLLQYLRAAGPATTLRMVRRSYPLQGIATAAKDEFFLAHLGVLPKFEGRGIGRRLLRRAEDRARAAGLRKITLTVDAANERALRLYMRADFRITSTVEFETLRRRFGYHGYHHMAKDLTDADCPH